MPKPPRPAALEVLRHNLLILVGLPSPIHQITTQIGKVILQGFQTGSSCLLDT